jgi:type II secretory pathway predicted ATPase ExeA
MYKSFFGLRENPFGVNPDPRYLYLTPQTQKALDQLTYGVQHCKGLILLTGEVGTGKTTLVHYLLNWLREQNRSAAFIFNSHLTVNHLFDFILTDFDVPIDFRLNENMLMRLNLWLMGRLRAGEKPVLIVDEAQGLSIGVLEEIRLLLNLETDSEKLLQIVLVGQPELEEQLKLPALRQLRQRIELRCNTASLGLEESHGYITERLRIAGADGKPIFPAETMDAVHFYSKGIPRVINLLCEHALINAYAEQAHQVPVWAVEEAARDFLLEDIRPVTVKQRGEDSSSDPLVMRSMFEQKLVRSFSKAESGLHDRASTRWLSAPAAFIDDEPAATKAKTIVTAIRRFEDNKEKETPDSKLSPPTAIIYRDENESVAAAKKNLGFAPKKGIAVGKTLNPATQLSRRSIYLRQMLRQWVVEFKRDWNAMMNAVNFRGQQRALFQWLRQPFTPRRMGSSARQ